jgi:PadR family transcriptional regulator, regulatory protein AphA
VSYVVLGLVARDGPSTPYAIKAAVGRGIAHFWQFPHSQIYAETERLARVGLLAEEREQTGRRRRSYRITAGGRAVLAAWLAEPTDEALQVRSLGLLKLFFSQNAEPEDVAELARVQAELLRGGAELTAVIMNDAFQAMARQWERVERAAAEPPGPVAAARDR